MRNGRNGRYRRAFEHTYSRNIIKIPKERKADSRRLLSYRRPREKDEDGYFWFESRNDDIIVSSGYTIGLLK